MTYIYESPDKGKTVYRRDFGAPASSRILIKSEKDSKLVIEWDANDIIEIAKTELNKPISFDQACDILQTLKSEYDPKNGINNIIIKLAILGNLAQ